MKASSVLIFTLFISLLIASCSEVTERHSDDELLVWAIENGEWAGYFYTDPLVKQIQSKYSSATEEEIKEVMKVEIEGMIDEIKFYTSPERGEPFHVVEQNLKGDSGHLFFGISSDLLYNYYDFQIKKIDGKFIIEEITNLYTGNRLTTLVDAVFNTEKKENLKMVQPMFEDYLAKRCEVAWVYYSSLPEKIQQLPEFTEIKVDVATCISDSLSKAVRYSLIASDQLSEQSKAIHQLEFGRVFSDVALLNEAISSLKTIVGNDHYLDQLLPKAYAKSEQYEEALSSINTYLEQQPDSEWGHYYKLDIYLFSGNHLGAKQWLSQIKKRYEVDPTYLANLYEIHPELK